MQHKVTGEYPNIKMLEVVGIIKKREPCIVGSGIKKCGGKVILAGKMCGKEFSEMSEGGKKAPFCGEEKLKEIELGKFIKPGISSEVGTYSHIEMLM